jgi:uncharacterized protein (TIGR00162 family)
MATKVIIFKNKKFSNAILLTGLPGIGLVGKICVDYLLKQLKSEKIGEIISDSFPPSAHTKNALIELIRDELFTFSFKDQDFIFLAGPVQPNLDSRVGSAQEHYEFAEKIVEAAKSLGVKKIITLAGLNVGDKRMESKPGVIAAATSQKVLDEFCSAGAIAGKAEGLISGAAGLILGIAKENSLEGVCLMGETNARLVYGDHGAAKKLLEVIVKKYGFKLNMEDIEKEAKNIEQAFKQLAKQFEEVEEKMPDEGPSYIR